MKVFIKIKYYNIKKFNAFGIKELINKLLINMPHYDIETNGLYEPLRVNKKDDWMIDFTEAVKKMKEREEYDRVWELIKKKNNW